MKINISEFILESAINWPECLAIEDEFERLTYKDLLQIGARLAEVLVRSGVIKNTPVAILIPKSFEAVTSIVATSFAGAIYVPLDTGSPEERLRAVLSQLGDVTLLCVESTEDLANSIATGSTRTLCIPKNSFDKQPSKKIEESIEKVKAFISGLIDLDPCYVIFTSGSTGSPKGVTVSHRSVIDYIEWAQDQYSVTEKHRLASQAPLYFDNSTLDLYLSFSTGASLFIPPERLFGFPKLVLEYIESKGITTVFWVPSVLVSIANSGLLEKTPPKSLEHVLFAGEVMPVPQINIWVRALPGVLFSNLYGPTEITVDCTAYTFFEPFEGNVLPIGFACRNSDILILNDSNERCGNDEVGELCVRGTSLALGYWNDPERSEKVFTQNPLEKRFRDFIYRTGDLARRDEFGCIVFLGRRDSQIKLNGYRIELGEIEAASAKLVGVARCAAAHDTDKGVIILFLELLTGFNADLAEIRRSLRKLLPKYMMPASVVIVSQFELNKNGKIDRLKLLSSIKN